MELPINTTHLGDCLELIPSIPDGKIDLILCDLPYGTTRCKWDTPLDLTRLWEEYRRVIKPNGAILLFAQTPFDKVLGASNLEMLRYEWIWEKTRATGHLNANVMPMKAHENILVFYKQLPTYNAQKTSGHKPVHSYSKQQGFINGEIYSKTGATSGGGSTERYPRSVLKFASDTRTSSLHATQKPIDLLEYLIKTYSNEGDLVLDNCSGSGSTGLACINTNRNYILMEIDEKSVSLSKERLNEPN